jgi:glutamate N-acetyltransferase/amino-acid N-acetyltransferase
MKAKGVLNKISGVFSGAVSAGISARKGKLDLAFLYIPECYSAAGVFTRSAFAAPCVSFTRAGIKNAKALIVNSGNANAATGRRGLENCKLTAEIAAGCLGLKAGEVVVSSTGIIGKQLPMECFRDGLPTLLSATSRKGGDEFAEAIMTTDLVPKEYFRERTIGGKKVKVAGVCKGSGMIAPNMATMLAFLVTDARIPRRLFQELLREVTDESFNMTSVDTDTSTNDMFLAFSTGGVEINPAKDRAALKELLLDCAVDLAKQIARDGEGATRLVEVKVSGGKTLRQARAVAKSVVDSPLVKTAIHGADPNWGRVAAATGKVSGVVADKVSISFAGTKVLQKGQPLRFNRDTLRARLNKPTVVVEVALGLGKFSATAWGCDLTHGYVDINTEYN